jgi:signal transduction histidine kinase
VRITFRLEGSTFRGEVEDDGEGFDLESFRSNGSSPQGLGLLGMQERVAQYCGRLEIVSSPGGGTRICVLIPLEETEDA